MKALASFLLLTLSFSAPLASAHEPETLMAPEEIQVGCGYAALLAHQEEAIRATRKLHPDWDQALLKQTHVQYQVGDSLQFFTYNYKTNLIEQTMAICRFKSDKTYIFVGKREWESEKVTDENVLAFQQGFEVSTPAASINPNAGIRTILENTIAPAPNKSADGYVYILIYDIQEEGSSQSYIAGYFMPNDQTDGSLSNRKDLLYIDCDPGNPGSADVLRIVAHEFQHLLHYGADPDEDSNGGTWVNEGASEYASVLCGYPIRRPSKYLRNPDRSLLLFDYSDDSLVDYEKVALWTYYLGEKFGPELIGQIVRQPENSVNGIRAALTKKNISLSVEDIFSRFVVANYLNDATLDPKGFYGYEKISLPIVAPSIDYGSYPVNSKTKSLSAFSSNYIRFSGVDSTAVLEFTSSNPTETRALMLHLGANPQVVSLPLDSQGQANYSLHSIGKTADNLVLTPVILNISSTVRYLVETRIEDLKPPVITSGPRESIPGSSSVTVAWDTDEYSDSIVEFGTTISYGRVVKDTTMTSSHRVLLSGLTANTRFHYRVGSSDAKGNGPTYSGDFNFNTATQSGTTIATVEQSHAYGYMGRSLAMDSNGHIHFLYHEKNGDLRNIFHQSSADQGKTWSSPVVIDVSLLSGGMPSVAVDSLDRLHIAWHAKANAVGKYGIFYSRSDDGGQTWSMPILVSHMDSEFDRLYAAIAVDRHNHPHIVWNSALYTDRYEGDIYHAYSTDQGKSWQADEKISQSTFSHCFDPTIDFDSKGRCHVVYSDGVFDNATMNVYYSYSDDYRTWSAPLRISESGVLYDGMVAMVVDPRDHVQVAYSDNYTPGDIRILHTTITEAELGMTKPIAASVLGTSGFAFHPSLSCDVQGAVYLLYCDTPRSTGLAKIDRSPEPDIDAFRWSRLQTLSSGDIYLSMSRNKIWLPGANISNDPVDSQNPEMPRRQRNSSSIQFVWMDVQNSTSNVVRYLNYNAVGESISPPKIVNRQPAPDAIDVPYFSANRIIIDFDQRIASDSLVPENVVLSGSKSGLIKVVLYYYEDRKQLQIAPLVDLEANDEITVHLSHRITNEIGQGLDGNGNGLDDGAPADDAIWHYSTQAPDVLPPRLTIGLAQNPVLSRYIDVYVFSGEPLKSSPQLTIGEEAVNVAAFNPALSVYKGDYKLKTSGMLRLIATAADMAGNVASTDRSFAAALIKAHQGGTLSAEDGHVEVRLAPGAMHEDAYVLIFRNQPADFSTFPLSESTTRMPDSYTIGPIQAHGQIFFKGSAAGDQPLVIQRKETDGTWIDLATSREGDRWTAQSERMGVFRLAESANLPTTYNLTQNYPNPFSLQTQETVFQIQLPQRQTVELSIYNLLGEKVHTVIQGSLNPGLHRISWDGITASGQRPAAGLYLYRLIAGSQLITKKMLILH